MHGIRTLLVCLTVIAVHVHGVHAAERFEYYRDCNEILSLEIQGDYIWCSTKGGVVRWDTRDSTYVKYIEIDNRILNYSGVLGYIHAASDGSIWYDPIGQYIFHFSHSSWNTIPKQEEIGARQIAESSNGELWFAHLPVYHDADVVHITHFDGNEWYEHPEFSELHMKPSSVAFDKTNILWVGSCTSQDEGSIASYNGEEWHKYTIDDGLISDVVNDVYVDNDNNKWFLSPEGVSRFNGSKWDTWYLDTTLEEMYVATITGDSEDTIYFGVHGGIFRFRDDDWQFIPLETYPDELIRDIACDDSGRVWCGSRAGLFCYDGLTWTEYREQYEMLYNKVSYIYAAKDGTVWIGPLRRSRTRYDGDQWTNYYFQGGAEILSTENSTWIVSEDTLYRYHGDTLETFPKYIPDYEAAVVDQDDTIWICGREGLYHFDGGEWIDYIATPHYKVPYFDGSIHDIVIDDNNVKWIGTEEGVVSFDGVRWRSYDSYDGLPNSGVKEIDIAPDGTIWCVHQGMLSSYDSETWTKHTTENGFPYLQIRRFEISDDGTVWCELKNYGLTSYDGTTWTSHIDDGGPTIEIGDIASRDHYTWFATEDGVWQYDGGSWEHILEDTTDEFAIDTAGRLWCDVGYGVKRYDGKSWITYTRENGLIWHRVTTIEAALDGSMWVGSEQGLTHIIPDTPTSVTVEKPEPVPVLTAFPNPFNPSTTIVFTIPSSGHASLAVYNLAGQKVRTLMDEPMSAGNHVVVWDGHDDAGRTVSAGVYFTRLTAGGTIATGKMVLVK